ncbi:MAG: uracil-DNA glycosylase [Clostridia bacterium]
MMIKFENSWDDIIGGEFKKEYYLKLHEFLKCEYRNSSIKVYPDMNNIFNAFKFTDYYDVKAVILGQDPYHGENQAHGLSFSVRDGIDKPPSLNNIFKELSSDIGFSIPKSGCLEKWAKNGVMLLNSVLTVRGGMPGSHRAKGWETFTDNAISLLNERKTPIVFILWGNYAKSKLPLITNEWHFVLTAPHPSPLSAYNGFFGCKHFSKTNDFLNEHSLPQIDWEL